MPASTTFNLPIVGMTCASSAGQVECALADAARVLSSVNNALWLKTWKPETPPQDDAQ